MIKKMERLPGAQLAVAGRAGELCLVSGKRLASLQVIRSRLCLIEEKIHSQDMGGRKLERDRQRPVGRTDTPFPLKTAVCSGAKGRSILQAVNTSGGTAHRRPKSGPSLRTARRFSPSQLSTGRRMSNHRRYRMGAHWGIRNTPFR